MMRKFVVITMLGLASCAHQVAQQANMTPQNDTDGATNNSAMIKPSNLGKDWSLIAKQIADQTYNSLSELKSLNQPLSVQLEQSTPFSDSLHEMIVTELVNKGVIVKTGMDNRYFLKHDVDYVSLDSKGVYISNANTAPEANVKVLVNSSLVRDGIYLMRRTDEYYVNKNDVTVHNQAAGHKAKTLNVVNRCGDKDCRK